MRRNRNQSSSHPRNPSSHNRRRCKHPSSLSHDVRRPHGPVLARSTNPSCTNRSLSLFAMLLTERSINHTHQTRLTRHLLLRSRKRSSRTCKAQTWANALLLCRRRRSTLHRLLFIQCHNHRRSQASLRCLPVPPRPLHNEETNTQSLKVGLLLRPFRPPLTLTRLLVRAMAGHTIETTIRQSLCLVTRKNFPE